MEELMTLFNRVGVFVAITGGGVSLVMFAFAGISYMTASGDPQAMGRAKMALIGAIGGSVVVGLAFIVPGVISRVIIEPSGGQAIEVEVGDNCDLLLRNQLVLTRGASTAGRMNDVIRTIQTQRDNCAPELWSPSVIDAPATSCSESTTGTVARPAALVCGGWNDAHGGWATGAVADVITPSTHTVCFGRVGNQEVPNSLSSGGDQRVTSGRDSDNNVLVYFSADASGRPADSALCWLFIRRLSVWSESY